MWLPKPVYELLPFAYLLLGIVAAAASPLFDSPAWLSTALFVGGLIAMAGGLGLLMKRKSERLNLAARRTREVELFDIKREGD